VVVFIMGGLRGAGRAGYRRGRFLTTNEKSFLMTLDAALGRNYAHAVIMRNSRVQPLHVPRWISGIAPSHKALLYA
jgi:hypothetical protein